MQHFVAIDAGTTGVRAMVFNDRGEPRGDAYRELVSSYPRPGWAEQDPDRLWRSTQAVLGDALAAADIQPADVSSIGVTNQRSSIIAWDASTLEPLAPMITWQDVRAAERVDELIAQGFIITPMMACTKAEWLVKNVDDVGAAHRAGRLRLGGVESWITAKLTGGLHVSDHANASSTGFYAHLELAWETKIFDAMELRHDAIAELVDSIGVVGETSAEAFGARVPVGALCGDQQASLFGLGCGGSSETKCSFGTSAMVDTNTGDSIQFGGEGTYPLVAWSVGGAVTWATEGSVVTAGAAVQWLRDGLGIVEDAADSAALAASVDDCGGVWAVPSLQGLGTPLMKSNARAMIGGVSRGSTKAHVVRAVLDGIANRVTDCAESVWQGRERPGALRADGGASANDVLMQLTADALGMPVECSREREGSALGIAAMAAAAVGAHGTDPGATPWRPERVFEPAVGDAERAERRDQWSKRVAVAATIE